VNNRYSFDHVLIQEYAVVVYQCGANSLVLFNYFTGTINMLQKFIQCIFNRLK